MLDGVRVEVERATSLVFTRRVSGYLTVNEGRAEPATGAFSVGPRLALPDRPGDALRSTTPERPYVGARTERPAPDRRATRGASCPVQER